MFKQIATKVAAKVTTDCFFAHGVYDAVKKELIAKNSDVNDKRKYPLIWLVTPIAVSQKNFSGAGELNDLQIFILCDTNLNYSEDDRVQGSFVGVLRPIYEELLRQIDASYLFGVSTPEAISHDYKEWSYNATTEGRTSLFGDYIDAIQIKNMRLIINEEVPDNFKMLTH